MTKIKRLTDRIRIYYTNNNFNDSFFHNTVLSQNGTKLVISSPNDSTSIDIELEYTSISEPTTSTLTELQKTLQGWINEGNGIVEIIQDSPVQLPNLYRLQNIAGELYWNGAALETTTLGNNHLVSVSFPLNGILRTTSADGTITNTPMPYFTDRIRTGLSLSIGSTGNNFNKFNYTSGTYQLNNIVYNIASGGQIVMTNGDNSNPRIDIVYLDSSNAIHYLAGTASSTPVAPSPPSPSTSLVIAEIGVAILANSTFSSYTLSEVNTNQNLVQAAGFGGGANFNTLFWNGNHYVPTSGLRSSTSNVSVGTGGGTNPGDIGIGTGIESLGVLGRISILNATAPGNITNKLWAQSGNLYWNGIQLDASSLAPGTIIGNTLVWDGADWVETTRLSHTSTDSNLQFDASNFININTSGLQIQGGSGNAQWNFSGLDWALNSGNGTSYGMHFDVSNGSGASTWVNSNPTGTTTETIALNPGFIQISANDSGNNNTTFINIIDNFFQIQNDQTSAGNGKFDWQITSGNSIMLVQDAGGNQNSITMSGSLIHIDSPSHQWTANSSVIDLDNVHYQSIITDVSNNQIELTLIPSSGVLQYTSISTPSNFNKFTLADSAISSVLNTATTVNGLNLLVNGSTLQYTDSSLQTSNYLNITTNTFELNSTDTLNNIVTTINGGLAGNITLSTANFAISGQLLLNAIGNAQIIGTNGADYSTFIADYSQASMSSQSGIKSSTIIANPTTGTSIVSTDGTNITSIVVSANTIALNGGQSHAIQVTTNPSYTLSTLDYKVISDSTSSTISLPLTPIPGQTYKITNVNALPLNFDNNGNNTIPATLPILNQYQSIEITYDTNTNTWYTFQ